LSEQSTAEQFSIEAALLSGEDRFRQIFNFCHDAIFVIDPTGDQILEVNPKACQMLGYSQKELLAIPISAVHPNEMTRLLAFTQSVYKQGHGWTDELTCMTKDQAVLATEISASLTEIEGKSCIIAMVRDITRRKQAEEALQKAYDTLEKRVEERTAQLAESNARLKQEIEERKRINGDVRVLAKFPSENPNPVLRIARDNIIIYANKASLPILASTTTRLRKSLRVHRQPKWYY
jgi:PAS domain S-box-containing protein